MQQALSVHGTVCQLQILSQPLTSSTSDTGRESTQAIASGRLSSRQPLSEESARQVRGLSSRDSMGVE